MYQIHFDNPFPDVPAVTASMHGRLGLDHGPSISAHAQAPSRQEFRLHRAGCIAGPGRQSRRRARFSARAPARPASIAAVAPCGSPRSSQHRPQGRVSGRCPPDLRSCRPGVSRAPMVTLRGTVSPRRQHRPRAGEHGTGVPDAVSKSRSSGFSGVWACQAAVASYVSRHVSMREKGL